MEINRPLITLSYAQSIDGSIAKTQGEPITLSCHQSMVMTHQLRADHDAILVGVGTVLADDPRLTVRHVAGDNPRPIILDSRLRCPPMAKLMARYPIIATTTTADVDRANVLRSNGATVVQFPANQAGYVPLMPLLEWLYKNDIATVMVEGGAQTISSFFAAALVDRIVITIAPRLIGGLNAINMLSNAPTLTDVTIRPVGNDVVITGRVQFQDDNSTT